MPTKQHTDTHNFGIRDKMMRFQLYERLIWYPWIGDIKVQARTDVGLLNAKDQVKMPKSVIHRLSGLEFLQAGTDYIHMPLMLKLEQPEKYGSHNLVGTGETIRHKFRKLFISQMSGTVNLKKSELDKLRTDKWEQYYDWAEPQIIDWFSERLNANFTSCFYEGHSLGITEGLNNAPDSIGAHCILHPNMYGWNSGLTPALFAIGTEGMNKTQAEINTDVQVGFTVPTAAAMDLIAEKLTERNIQKGLIVDGQPFWLAVINLRTWHNLKQDANIRADIREVSSTSMYNNVLFAPKMYRWGDFCFIVDQIAPRSWHVTRAGSPGNLGDFMGNNGYHGQPTAHASYPNTTINIYGDGALGFADVKAPWTKFDVQNFEQQKEMAMMSLFGLGRNDWIHKSLEPTYYACGNADRAVIGANLVLNQSSAVFFVSP